MLDATESNSFGAEYIIPIVAGSAVYWGIASGAVAASLSEPKPVKEGAKSARFGAIIFPLEFAVGYGIGYVAGKVLP